MTGKGKRLLALLLALMLCVALLPAAALAEEEGTIAPAEDPEALPPADEPEEVYSGECGDNLTWSFDQDTGVLTISGTGDMWDWMYDEAPWVDHYSSIASVELLEGVTGIGDYAFSGCYSLESVTLPEGLTGIGNYAFAWCDSLTSVEVPASVTEIRDNAFSDCRGLAAIEVAEGNENYSSLDGILYNHAQTALIRCPGGKSGAVEIPAGVTSIGDGAFAGCSSLTSVELPAGLTSIGFDAFTACDSLESVTLPAGLTDIGSWAFSACDSLESVTLPASVTKIEHYAFYNCSGLKNIRFKGSAPTIGENAFEGVTATAYYPAGDESWTEDVRQNYGGDLTWEPYEKEPEVIASGECGDDLTWFLGGDGSLLITGTGDMWDWEWGSAPWTDYSSSITSVELPYGLIGIGKNAFSNFSSLTSVIIPEGVTEIRANAFCYCSGLTSVEIPASVTGIGDYSFSGCTALTNVELPASVTSIGEGAFQECSSLTSMTIPEGVTSIGDWAFYYCSSLTSVEIPAKVISIGIWAFSYCSSLKNVVFLGAPPEIGECSFGDVTADAWYPADDETWTEEVRQDYGGTLTWIPCLDGKPVNSFADVAEGKYYYNAVLWAYYHDPQITGGTSETTFSPNKTCTREQIVTFLWKACGAPEPETTTNPFTDVKESKYYYKAVLWAVEKGITGGMSETLFGVGKPCTREQAMTFLWKACGAPEPETTTNPFTDVLETKYYYNAVMWAVEKGITGGMGNGLFGVGKTCTRGQIVTFLYAARDILGA